MATITTKKILSLNANQSFEDYEVHAVLSSAEVLALATNPVQLVAAVPGAFIWPVAGFCIFRGATQAYNTISSLVVGPTGDIDLQFLVGDLPIAEVSPAVTIANLDVQQVTGLLSLALGQPLFAYASPSDPTDGDGTLEVTVLYRVIDVS